MNRCFETGQNRDETVVDSGEKSKNDYLRAELAVVLVQMGIPIHVKGYKYIIEGIMLAMEDNSLFDEMTGRFYPVIADSFHTTAANIERSMRRAIELAWRKPDNEVLNKIFGEPHKKPTNSEFIKCLTRCYQYHYHR